MSKPDGGPAFPLPHVIVDANDPMFKPGYSGMSLRDYFASHAPDIGTINVKADREALAGREQPPLWPNGLDSIRFNAEVEAALQYLYAEAMLAERAK